ncbi:hypothetical protein HYH03_001500 [Edaphochlamys debaryana]|uniref:Exostosin GT47 domain-containing protein n=1 Tax=Edaphochlamys debaryana TaxID=47281 RepID=A0A835YGX3_9CHLO|nr:hypothetical protein HYH03_001500 [Edaphochlamys debaryana]|eukprot:KAG2500736.1 hypothetical protein HYH03_001500 [Edaphochlamys debaryana]
MRALGQAFTDNLAALLPRITEKPHFLVGNHESVCYQADGILTSPLAPYLTLWATALWTEIPLKVRSLALNREGPALLRTAQGRELPASASGSTRGYFGNLIPMPYPSYVHHYQGCDTCNLSVQAVAGLKHCDVFAAFELRKHFQPGPWSIREQLLEQCHAKPEQCAALSAKDAGSDSGILDLIRGMEQSWFCLQPHGDTPSRKGVYDSLLLGCIPVVFDRYVLDTFPFADVLDPSRLVAYVPRSVVNATNIVDHLNRRYPPKKRQAMLAHILAVKHVFQWSLSSDPRPLRWDALDTASPHDDAFSMLLKRTVEGGCRRGLTGMRHCELLAAAVERGDVHSFLPLMRACANLTPP